MRVTTLLSCAILLLIGATLSHAASLHGAGATFPQPLYEEWFRDFQERTGHSVRYLGIGSGGGIEAIRKGTVHFAGSDAPLSDSQLQALPRPVVQIPTVGGAVAVVHNSRGFSEPIQLSPETLTGIFMGKITRWNAPEIRAENRAASLPVREITVVRRKDSSGTSFLFTTYLSEINATWKSQVGAGKTVNWPAGRGGTGNPGVASLVKQVPGAIGYVELAYALRHDLPTAELKNRSGRYVAPSLSSATRCIAGSIEKLKTDLRTPVVNGEGPEAYPIVGLTFLLTYRQQQEPTIGRAIRDLFSYCLNTGQGSAPSLQYVPLPESIIPLCNAKLNRISLARAACAPSTPQ